MLLFWQSHLVTDVLMRKRVMYNINDVLAGGCDLESNSDSWRDHSLFCMQWQLG